MKIQFYSHSISSPHSNFNRETHDRGKYYSLNIYYKYFNFNNLVRCLTNGAKKIKEFIITKNRLTGI